MSQATWTRHVNITRWVLYQSTTLNDTILRLTPLKREDALRCTLEAHEKGHSALLVTHKERAELYCEQFATRKLTVTCEPV